MAPMRPVRFLLRGLRDLVFPPGCLLCGNFIDAAESGLTPFERAFCAECRDGFPTVPPAHCRVCGRPFQTTLPTVHACGHCRKTPPRYDQAVAVGLYRDGLRKAVHHFKYNGRTEFARPLAAFMASRLESPFYPPQSDLILPVPLHRRRLRQRGFNQALLLARALYPAHRSRIQYDLLVRNRWTEPQVNLKGRERRDNVRRAFTVTDPSRVKGSSVTLVDDVYTTGATANECARVLKKAGAAQVRILTLARVA